MEPTFKDAIVYGERVRDLGPALKAMGESTEIDANGRYHFSFDLPHEEAAPFVRASFRAEAELLIEDADCLDSPTVIVRTPEQRRADAVLRVVRGIGDAMDSEQPVPPPPPGLPSRRLRRVQARQS